MLIRTDPLDLVPASACNSLANCLKCLCCSGLLRYSTSYGRAKKHLNSFSWDQWRGKIQIIVLTLRLVTRKTLGSFQFLRANSYFFFQTPLRGLWRAQRSWSRTWKAYRPSDYEMLRQQRVQLEDPSGAKNIIPGLFPSKTLSSPLNISEFVWKWGISGIWQFLREWWSSI